MPEQSITSLQNPRVKHAAALRRRPGRADEILIDGARELSRALDAQVQVLHVFDCPAKWRGPEADAMRRRLRAASAEILEIGEAALAKIAYGDRAEGVVAVARRPRGELAAFRPPSPALVALIEGVEKPGNLGAILRSADAAGVHGVIAVDSRCDIYSPNAIRASLGTVFSVPVFESGFDDASHWLGENRIHVVAADPSATTAYTEVDLKGPTAVLLGSEAAGLTGRWASLDPVRARIPMRGRADSLNVSVTAAVFFFEAQRQRGSNAECKDRSAE